MATYAISPDGLIHLVNDNNSEFTLCGDAFDGDSECPTLGWSAHPSGPVTCHNCAKIIKSCRGVRIKLEK
jgi:hypothetical protein